MDRIINKNGETEVRKITQHQKQFFDQQEIEIILSEYKLGKTTTELAKQFSCHRTTISNILKRHNIKVDNSKAIKKIDAEKVISMYAEMHTASEIARQFNTYPQVIIRCLKNNGIRIRNRWEYPASK